MTFFVKISFSGLDRNFFLKKLSKQGSFLILNNLRPINLGHLFDIVTLEVTRGHPRSEV